MYVRALRPAAGEATLRPLARLALLQGWTTGDQAAYERWRRGEADVAEVDGEASDGALALKAHSTNLKAPNTQGCQNVETGSLVRHPVSPPPRAAAQLDPFHSPPKPGNLQHLALGTAPGLQGAASATAAWNNALFELVDDPFLAPTADDAEGLEGDDWALRSPSYVLTVEEESDAEEDNKVKAW